MKATTRPIASRTLNSGHLWVGMLVLCAGVTSPLVGGPTASTARAAPSGTKAQPQPQLFASRRRTKYWRKRCRQSKARALRRADALQAVRRAPVSLFAATARSGLYRLALQPTNRLVRLLNVTRKRRKGARRRSRLGEVCYALAIGHQLSARRHWNRIRRLKALGKRVPKALVSRHLREVDQARQWLGKALGHYQAIVAMGHGSLKRQAEPLFLVASLSMELATHPANRHLVKQRLKYAQLILKSLRTLLKHHPRSPYIERALLAKGAMYYHLGQHTEAIAVLQQVRKLFSREAPYAMYLLGWSLFKAKRFKKARIHLRGATRSSRSSKRLVRIARQDLVLITSRLSGLASSGRAYKYFRSSVKGRNKGAARRMVRRLARVYVAQNKRRSAIGLYRSFLARWPRNKEACGWVRTLEGLLRGSR